MPEPSTPATRSKRGRPSHASPGELDLIQAISRHFSGIATNALTLGIGDDCAILRPPPGSELLVTTDLLLEGRHFRRDLHPATSAGHRCLARGLSDLAAMGAAPLAAFLSLALPASMLREPAERRWLGGFLRGMAALARVTPVPLAGGDTGQLAAAGRSRGDEPSHIVADIILVGHTPAGSAMRRSAARSGDQLYVTGSLGGAAAELEAMLAGKPALPRRRSPQRFPVPRLAVGAALRQLGVRAALDISDGLSSDLQHLVRASHVRAVVEQGALPLAPLLRDYDPAAALRLALHGGEDYELLFTAAPELVLPCRLEGVALTRIGSILPPARSKTPVTLRDRSGVEQPLAAGGWEHFRRRNISRS